MRKNTLYITGHKNPDADSIISAMAYAYFKQQMGYDALAIRIGEINQETEFILNMFNEFAPPLVSDIKTRIRDIDFDDAVFCKSTDNFKTAIDIMNNAHKKVIVVVDDKQQLQGMATISDITKGLLPESSLREKIIKQITIEQIVNYLNCSIVYQPEAFRNNGKVIIGSYNKNVITDSIVISNDTDRIIDFINKKAGLIISDVFTSEQIALAKENDCALLESDKEVFEIANGLYFASSIDKVMSKNLTTFRYEDYVDDVKAVINKSRFRSYPVVDSLDHVIGTLSRYHVFKHANRNLILVDHNELSQSIDGADEANIIEVIDHHRIGGIKTASPMHFRNETVGCCATIITKIFLENNVEIPEDLAGLLCCAIISDTLNFRSVTCSEEDKQQAAYLAAKANIKIEEIGTKILAAGAKFTNKSIKSIFEKDLKQFMVGKTKVTIGQSNAADFVSIISLREEMVKTISEYSHDSGSGIVVMAFSMIDGSGSYILVQGKEARRLADTLKKNGINVAGYTFLPKVISRKQQLIPLIAEALEVEG